MKIKGLTIIFFLSLTITVWINFVNYKFSTIPFFSGKEYKLEGMIDGFSLSYIAGHFFFFINVYLVERTEKKSNLPYISFRIKVSIPTLHQKSVVFSFLWVENNLQLFL